MSHPTDHIIGLTLRSAGVAALALAIVACGTDNAGGVGEGGSAVDESPSPPVEATSTPSSESSTSAEPEPTPSSAAAADPSAEAGADDGSGQVSYVEFGDVRYEAESMECSRNDGGFEYGADATGPYSGMVTIAGVFGVGEADNPPDLVTVTFDAGEGGQWSAMSEVQGFSVGSLSDASYDASGASGEGVFAFHLGGDVDSATEPGRFEFFC
ncbi:hypothetical protein ACNI3K_08755 [Demequina sp. SO4-13]|uniref:hypothetical protein n=1 Tax=Demequina sp. SO4-13 TaxID=3401027 RepID=UPI003AF5CD81